MNIKIQHQGNFYTPKLPDNIREDVDIVIMDQTFGRPLVCAIVWDLTHSIEVMLLSYKVGSNIEHGIVTYFLTEQN